MTVKLILADDHAILRQGLRRLLESDPAFLVVGEAADGLEAVQLVEQKRPDVLIVDLMMPALNGLEVTRQLASRAPATRIIILSMHQDDEYVLQALRSGAMGYVLKESTPTELAQAIHDVVQGERYLSRKLNNSLISLMVKQSQEKTPAGSYEQLSDREREVLQLVAEGLSSAEIARRLSISRRTVETHRASLMHKMGFANTTDVVRFAIKRGIISLE